MKKPSVFSFGEYSVVCIGGVCISECVTRL